MVFHLDHSLCEARIFGKFYISSTLTSVLGVVWNMRRLIIGGILTVSSQIETVTNRSS